jgi:hypothetical protein
VRRRPPTALVVSFLLALALPAVALAGRRVISGPAGGGGGEVDITLVTKNATVKKLTRFEFNNIAASCAGGQPTAVSNAFPHTIPVASDGRFHATVKPNGGRVTYTVSGHFKDRNHASGTLRVKGAVPGCASADSGRVHWTTKHN